MSMDDRTLLVVAVASVIVAIVAAVAIGCTVGAMRGSDNARQVKLACIEQGQQWISGNCIAVAS